MAPPVAVILGSGSVVGKSVAKALAAHGYRVAVGSRHPNRSEAEKEGFLPLTVDVTLPESVESAFAKVKSELGSAASVVVYNASTWVPPPTAGDPLSLPTSALVLSTVVGVSVFDTVKHAVSGFRDLESSQDITSPKVFIMTGNVSPFRPPSANITAPQLQKKVGAHFMETFAGMYKDARYRFYFASQVSRTGGVPGKTFSGPAHAIAYWRLIQEPQQLFWDQRFTEDGSSWIPT